MTTDLLDKEEFKINTGSPFPVVGKFMVIVIGILFTSMAIITETYLILPFTVLLMMLVVFGTTRIEFRSNVHGYFVQFRLLGLTLRSSKKEIQNKSAVCLLSIQGNSTVVANLTQSTSQS